jgi:hypothetical protein
MLHSVNIPEDQNLVFAAVVAVIIIIIITVLL